MVSIKVRKILPDKIHLKKFQKKLLFYSLRQTEHCPAKVQFFPRFRSLCMGTGSKIHIYRLEIGIQCRRRIDL